MLVILRAAIDGGARSAVAQMHDRARPHMRWDLSSMPCGRRIAAADIAFTLRPMNPSNDNDAVFPNLRRMADEIRVRIHLAGRDAKDAWAKLETRLEVFEGRAAELGDRAKDQLALLGTGIEYELRQFAGRLPSKAHERTGASSN